MPKQVCINNRILFGPTSGVQRYLIEILKYLPENQIDTLSSIKFKAGFKGHLWEQLFLQNKIDGKLLWSPANTGPISISHQVVTLHDIATFEVPENFNKKFSTYYKNIVPKLLLKSQKIITVSNFMKTRAVELFELDPGKISVIQNGINEKFKPVGDEKNDLVRKKLGIPTPYYIVGVGSLEPRKNLHRLIKAWGIAQSKISKDVWLVLVGMKGKPQVFRKMSFDYIPPRVHFTGYIEDGDLPALYSGAMASAYLSVYEGFGLPPLEAMACGTPSITGNLTSLPEVIGNSGVMVDPYDIEAIEDGLFRIIDDSVFRNDLRGKGLERAKNFSWKKSADLTWKLLLEESGKTT
ncbi:MAG: glycosyltransferase family 4 protein [Chloroflexi bacterium]|jgi:glycosyltransferase involved in cell wall biosynthesis|nr:glycosyltransferase family 4 protein [Chloroflexota bacterium]